METYLKKFIRELHGHKDNLNEYIDQLYKDESRKNELNELLGELEKEGILTLQRADNKIYDARFTIKGKNISSSELKLSNKEELLVLINSIESIEKLFRKPDNEWEFYETIHDVKEFQEWLQQIIMYLQEIFDRTHDTFVFDTINSCKIHMDGANDRELFSDN